MMNALLKSVYFNTIVMNTKFKEGVMASFAINDQVKYSWADYQTWSDDERWEIIDGTPYNMSPAPRPRHQNLIGNIYAKFHSFFKGKTCMPFMSTVDVKLSDWDIVQPDLIVVCDKETIKDTHIDGVPSLVIEVLSPSTEKEDRHQKLNLYAKAGVKEYWLVQPFPSFIEVLVLDNGKYRIEQVFDKDEELISPSFPDLKIDLKEIFDFDLEPHEKAMFEVRESPAVYRTY